MSKRYFVLALVAVCMLFSTQKTNAQEAGSVTLGAGVAYGFDIEELGLQVNGYYTMNEKFRLGGDVIYWLLDTPSGVTNTLMEFNFNVHYIFYQEEAITLYGIGSAGIHYQNYEASFEGFSASHTDTDLGIGIGAGAEYDLGSLVLYGEPRFFLSGFDQLALNLGVRIRL